MIPINTMVAHFTNASSNFGVEVYFRALFSVYTLQLKLSSSCVFLGTQFYSFLAFNEL